MKYIGQKAIRRLFCWLLLATGVLSQFVLRAADFGFVQIWRSVRMVFGQDVAQPWPGMMAIARLSQVCGLVALLIGARRRDYLLVVGGMLVAAGNMYYYAALYLLPVFVLESRPTKGSVPVEWAKGSVPAESSVRGYVVAEYLLWFVLGCPLQLIILGHAANGVFCNLALMGLMTMRIARGKPR